MFNPSSRGGGPKFFIGTLLVVLLLFFVAMDVVSQGSRGVPFFNFLKFDSASKEHLPITAPPIIPVSPGTLPTSSPSVLGSGCVVTGCSGEVCAEEEVITTCEYRPQYVCYKTAICERQASGECGWTETPELTACLND